MGELVRLEVRDGVGTIRLDRPPVNALNDQMRHELTEVAQEVSDRQEIRAVIIYGGEKIFAGGADIKEMANKTVAEMTVFGGALSASLSVLAAIPKPTVAAITGHALGGGMELALTADWRIASAKAKVGQPEILLGVIPGAGGTQRLTRLIGPSKAKELIYTGRLVAADEALALGVVDQVVAPEQVYEAAFEWASRFTRGPALALRAAKLAVDTGQDIDLASGLKLETQLFATLWASEDQTEGMRSFLENGPGKATFTGQ
jgi:enoyl-CoA hydratase